MPNEKPTRSPIKINMTSERGETGLKRMSGFVYEEFLTKLQGSRGIEVYKEMATNDAMVHAMLHAISMLIRGVEWRVDAASDAKEDVASAEFLESVMDDMEHSWDDFITEILSMLIYGWSWHEVVYKRRLGESSDLTKNSKFNDGRIGWRKMPIRSQDTLWEWKFSDNGDILAMIQQSPVDFLLKTIPIEKSLLFRTTMHKNNPEGKSLLRGAYRAWYFKKRIEEIEGIGIERDLAGLPVMWVPPEILSPNAAPEDVALANEFKKVLRNIKRDEQEGLLMPLALDERGNKLYDFQLVSSGGKRNFDTTVIINRYNRDIAMSVLADFILLGHEKVGSFALSSSKTNMFAASLGAIMDSIEETINNKAVKDLFRLNSFNLTNLPAIRHGDLETVDLTELSDFITKLSGAGMEFFPDDDLENYLRGQAGLPEKKEFA